MKKPQLICILGPTAIGKTKLGIELAQHYGTEIISADSRQFYKEMEIGTAVPTKEELSAAKHHFIQHISIKDHYSVGDFERDADYKLQSLFKSHEKIILVGGSGLYAKAVTDGLDEFPEVNKNIREQLNTEFEQKGIIHLQNELLEVDPKAYQSIAIENPQRLIRALSVYRASGKPYSSFLGKKKENKTFNTLKIGLTAPRDVIYDRINKRVDMMLQNGLLAEAKNLYEQRNLNALNTVGYKELFKYISGEYSLDFAISEIKKNTRRFAKRQLTWFKNQENAIWFDYKTPTQEIIETINRKCTQAT